MTFSSAIKRVARGGKISSRSAMDFGYALALSDGIVYEFALNNHSELGYVRGRMIVTAGMLEATDWEVLL